MRKIVVHFFETCDLMTPTPLAALTLSDTFLLSLSRVPNTASFRRAKLRLLRFLSSVYFQRRIVFFPFFGGPLYFIPSPVVVARTHPPHFVERADPDSGLPMKTFPFLPLDATFYPIFIPVPPPTSPCSIGLFPSSILFAPLPDGQGIPQFFMRCPFHLAPVPLVH